MAALFALRIFQKPGCVLFALCFGFSHCLLALTFLAHYSGRVSLLLLDRSILCLHVLKGLHSFRKLQMESYKASAWWLVQVCFYYYYYGIFF